MRVRGKRASSPCPVKTEDEHEYDDEDDYVPGEKRETASVGSVKQGPDHSVEGPAAATRSSVFAVPAASSTRFPNFSISLR
jgi:hypothetical protein